jgi:large repetitive protein
MLSAPSVQAAAYVGAESMLPLVITGDVGSTATYTVTSGSRSVTGTGTVWRSGEASFLVDVSSLADGLLTVVATLTNALGTSTPGSATVKKDTVAPGTPRVSGVPTYINLANRTSVTFLIDGEPGVTATVTVSDGITTELIWTAAAIGSGGSAGAELDLSLFADGVASIWVTVVDAAGNAAAPVRLSRSKDTVAPTVAAVGLLAGDDTGASAVDYMTRVNAPHFLVAGEQGATATVYVNGVAYTGQTLGDGTYLVAATLTDAAGNVSEIAFAARSLVVDTLAPTGKFAIQATGALINGQLATRVRTMNLKMLQGDNATGMSLMAISTDGGVTFGALQAFAESAAITLPDADGLYTVVVKVFDLAGNTSTSTQTVRLDTRGPQISASITAPSASGFYDLGQAISLSYGAADVDNVATISGGLDSATSISSGGAINLYTLTAGMHTIVVTATDGLGNASSTTITFQLRPTVSGLSNAVRYGVGAKLVANQLQSSLLSTLQTAQTALGRGDTAGAKNALKTFIGQVQKAGSKITASFATLLINWTQDLIARI